jgi:iron complex outermembrane receptor protein
MLGAAGAAGVAAPALAQDIRVDVTGSSIKRIEGETALPVTVMTRDEIDRTGAQSVYDLLQYVSSNNSGGAINVTNVIGAQTYSTNTASLRGLGGQNTLVLMNGKRLVTSGGEFQGVYGVNLDAIPYAAIERVEILKDGASAIYGSDAIGGVINFILRQDFTGVEATAYYGEPTRSEGDGSIFNASVTAGWGDLAKDRFNVFVSPYYQQQDPLNGNQRNFSDSSVDLERGLLGVSGNTFPAHITTGGIGTPGYPNCAPGIDIPDFGRCFYDPAADSGVNILPDQKTTAFFGSGRFQINPNWQAYGTASYTEVKTRYVIQPTPISDQITFGNDPFNLTPATFLLPPTSPFYPHDLAAAAGVDGQPLNLRYRAYALGHRDQTDTNENWQGVLGLKGTAWNWDFDFDLNYSASETRSQTNGGFALYSQLVPLLNSGTINPFGTLSPEAQAAMDAVQFRQETFRGESQQFIFEGKASGDVWKLPAGSMAAAVGFQAGKQELKQDFHEELQLGNITGFGGSSAPIDADRDFWSVYGELNIPVLRNLEVNAALRYDDYSDFGSTTNPKISFRYNPIKEVVFRGSWGTGFVAPTLSQAYGAQIAGLSQPGLADPVRCPVTGDTNDCITQFTIVFGGNPNLKPQESDQWQLGFVLEPVPGFSIAWDWFNLKLENQITNGVPPLTILNDQVQYANLITRGPPSPGFPNLPGPITSIDQRFINLGTVKIEGWDVDIRARSPQTSVGRFDFNLQGTYYVKWDQQQPDGTFAGFVSNQFNAATSGVTPRYRQYATLTWTYGPWSGTLGNSYQSSYVDNQAVDEDDEGNPITRRVDSLSLWDLYGSYTGLKNWKFVLGVKNLFDEDPPFTNQQTTFQVGYDPTYYDARGRFLYGSVTYTFK